MVVCIQKKRAEKEAVMMVIMRYSSFMEALVEIQKIFIRNKPLKLHRSKAFRAWYKNKIDFMLQHPDICHLTMKEDGSPYDKEKDDLYDPNALDWELFDEPRYYDDDDKIDCVEDAAAEGFMMGVGMGVADDILDD